jgi:dipeptidyl-peptidase-4
LKSFKIRNEKTTLNSYCCCGISNVSAQEITLDKIYSGYYRGKGIAGITSMKNGENYLVIEPTGIAKYSYKTSQKEGNLVDGSLKAIFF